MPNNDASSGNNWLAVLHKNDRKHREHTWLKLECLEKVESIAYYALEPEKRRRIGCKSHKTHQIRPNIEPMKQNAHIG